MTDHQSNSLLSDPSILQVSSNDQLSHKNSKSQSNVSLSNLEPGNALSQLLDSAMLNAAKETSPDVDSFPNSQISSPTSSKNDKYDFQFHKSNSDRVYTIDQLLAMKNSSDTQIVLSLPDKEFWCLGGGRKFVKEFNPKSNRRHGNGSFPREKPDHHRKKKPELNEFFGGQEAHQHPDTEWNEPPEIDDKLKQEMGDTVEDFERWKEAQRRKNDPNYNPSHEPAPAQPSNDVDSFFSFVSAPNNPLEDKRTEDGSRSSRFSSFFTPPELAESKPAPQQQTPRGQPDMGAGSRFFAGSTTTNGDSSSPQLPKQRHPMPMQPQAPHFMNLGPQGPGQGPPPNGSGPNQGPPPPGPPGPPGHQGPNHQGHQGPPPGHPQHPPPGMPFPPPGLGQFNPAMMPNRPKGANDSFFMSLMNKPPSDSKDGQPPINQLPPWLHPQGGQSQGPPGLPQGQRPQGPPGIPHQNPNQNQGHFQGPPGIVPPGDRDQKGQSVPNMMPFPYGPPPPGMVPPGMMQQGMHIPPQFMNDPNFIRNMPPSEGPPGQRGHPGQRGPPGQGANSMMFPPGLGGPPGQGNSVSK